VKIGTSSDNDDPGGDQIQTKLRCMENKLHPRSLKGIIIIKMFIIQDNIILKSVDPYANAKASRRDWLF